MQKMAVLKNGKLQTENFDPNLSPDHGWRGEGEFPDDAFMRYEYEDKDNYVWLRQIYVRADKRRKGNGSKLFKFLEKEAERVGKHSIYVQTGSDSHDTFGKFLLAWGYKTVEQGDNPDGRFHWFKQL